MNNLEMATRDELLTELKSRYDELVIVGRSSRTDELEDRFMYFKGSTAAAYGSAKKLEIYLESLLRGECLEEIAAAHDIDDDEEDEDDDDLD